MDTKNIFTKTFQKKTAEKLPKPAVEKAVETAEIVEKKPKSAPKAAKPAAPPPAAPKREAAVAAVASRAMMFDSENIVRAIHKAKEENQRITVDVPMDIYRSMKLHLAAENVSIRDFVVRLIDVYLTKNEIR